MVVRRRCVVVLMLAVACGRTPVLAAEDGGGDDERAVGWLLAVDTNAYELQVIDPLTAATASSCTLPADGSRYISATEHTAGGLLVTYRIAAAVDSPVELARLDPCSCEREVVQRYEVGKPSGLVWDDGRLLAINHFDDELLELDPASGDRHVLGPLGADISSHGASPTGRAGSIFVLDGGRDVLLTIDAHRGAVTSTTFLSLDFGSVGVEADPESGRVYACTDDAILYGIDSSDGEVTAIGPIAMAGNCGSLTFVQRAPVCVGG